MNANGALWLKLESLISVDGNPFPGICYSELSLKNHCVGGRARKLNFVIFVCSLKCFNCWCVDGGMEQKVLFRAG